MSDSGCFRCGYVRDDSGSPECSTSRISCPVCNMPHQDDDYPIKHPKGQLLVFGDIVEKNGGTVRENNMAVGHNIPIGTLVEVKYDRWHGGGACSKVHARLFVLEHTRDCDGTPLYSLGFNQSCFADTDHRKPVLQNMRGLETGFAEESLTPVEVDDRLCEGHGALEWDS